MSATQQVLAAWSSAAATDPFWAYVVALLHCNGANNSTSFPDETGRSWTNSGVVLVKTAESVFGGASGFFDATDSCLVAVDAAALEIGSQDFFIEARVRFDITPGATSRTIASKNTANLNRRSWLFRYNGTTTDLDFLYSTDGTNQTTVSAAWAPAANTWYSVAVGRTSGTLYLFVNGVMINSASAAVTLYDSNVDVRIGANLDGSANPTQVWSGYIDEFRWTIGAGRHTATYTLESSEFPNS